MAAKILIVEDETLIRKNICAFLRKEGYEVTEARDGAQAADLLNSERFDLLITDIALPHLNGSELVEHVNGVSPQTPVILVSGYLPSSLSDSAVSGAVTFLEKPIALKALLRVIQRLLKSC
jgi:DNA-binding NtrC family response regulator